MTELLDFLRTNDRFLLLTHRRPDGDTLGSAAGLALGLRALGKTVFLAPNPDVTPRYAPLAAPLFAPQGYFPEHFMSLDTAARDLLPDAFQDVPVDWRIDHHPTGGRPPYARRETVDTSAAACGELVIDIIRGLGVALTRDIARPLYLALSTDTGCFRYASTTARTLRLTADLMDTGFDAGAINDLVFFSKTRERIAVEAYVLDTMEYLRGGSVALARLPLKVIRDAGACEDDMENVSSLTRQIAGVIVGITLREEEEGVCKISVRTAAPIDAGRICTLLGGGGHARAAGCRPTLSMEEARRAVLSALEEVWPCDGRPFAD